MAGILISMIGVVFLLIFLVEVITHNYIITQPLITQLPTIGNLGLLAILLGVLVVASDLFVKKVHLQGVTTILAVAGWSLFSVGLLVGFAGFLLMNQAPCLCPAYGPCPCGVPLYNLMFSGGILTAVVGVVIMVVIRLHSGQKNRSLIILGCVLFLVGFYIQTLDFVSCYYTRIYSCIFTPIVNAITFVGAVILVLTVTTFVRQRSSSWYKGTGELSSLTRKQKWAIRLWGVGLAVGFVAFALPVWADITGMIAPPELVYSLVFGVMAPLGIAGFYLSGWKNLRQLLRERKSSRTNR